MPGGISSTRRDVISWRLPSPRIANRNFTPQMLCETLRLCVKQKTSAKVRAVRVKRDITQRRKGTQRICSFVLLPKPIRRRHNMTSLHLHKRNNGRTFTRSARCIYKLLHPHFLAIHNVKSRSCNAVQLSAIQVVDNITVCYSCR